MKKTALLAGLLAASSAWAAESPVLKDIMGETVYEDSGITELSDEQLRVLENWILNNAVEIRVVQPKKPEPKPVQAKQQEQVAQPVSEPSPARPEDTRPPVEVRESEPRYVRLAEEKEVSETEEEPVTQKYVKIEALDERDRDIQPDLIRSRIDGKFRGWRDNHTRFKLENGEIWQQRQSATYVTNLDSPEVIIRKNRFGYTMEVPAIGRKVHVKRVR